MLVALPVCEQCVCAELWWCVAFMTGVCMCVTFDLCVFILLQTVKQHERDSWKQAVFFSILFILFFHIYFLLFLYFISIQIYFLVVSSFLCSLLLYSFFLLFLSSSFPYTSLFPFQLFFFFSRKMWNYSFMEERQHLNAAPGTGR